MTESLWFPDAISPIISAGSGPAPIGKQRKLALSILNHMRAPAERAIAGADHQAKANGIRQAMTNAEDAVRDGRMDLAMAATWSVAAGISEFLQRTHYASGGEHGRDQELLKERKKRQLGPLEKLGIKDQDQYNTREAVFFCLE